MKIDAVLALHPWPWKGIGGLIHDANGENVTFLVMNAKLLDAFLELVEAYVANKAKETNHGS